MGKAYQKLSHAELAELKREAVRLTAERNALLSVPVSDRSAAMEASGTDLRPSQVKRTYQKRLDISLHQVTGHNSWDHGFALSDHVCALKPSFVTPYIGKEDAMYDLSKHHLHYDASVVKNDDDLPAFSRTCRWANCGICREDAFYDLVKDLVRQFDIVFSSRKFGVASSPFVVKLHLVYTDRASSSSEQSHHLGNDPTWVVIGAVTAKPVSYTGIRLFVNTGLNFGIKTDNNIPCGDSLHRIFKELIGKHVSNGGSKEDISAQVGFRSLEPLSPHFFYDI